MRERIHRYHQTVLLLIMAAVLLTACSSDSSEAQAISTGDTPKDHVVHLVSYAPGYMETATTRSAPTGYSDYLLDKVTEMGIYVFLPPENYETPATPAEQTPLKYVSKWHAYFSVDKGKAYTVYGYLPKTAGMNSSLVKASADEAELTITGMKPITTDDICIITGVKESETGLKEGSFSWTQAVTNDDYYIYMLLNHLYASVRFCMKINEEYANLRIIKLKSMTLSTDQEVVNATVSLTHNTTGEIPITGVTYTETGSSCETVIFSDDEGMPLSPETAIVIDAYFAPTLSSHLTLVSTYDVYDRYNNLIREGCTATNKIPDLETSRGKRAQLNLTVNPTYLYVLSDADLDNPSVTVN